MILRTFRIIFFSWIPCRRFAWSQMTKKPTLIATPYNNLHQVKLTYWHCNPVLSSHMQKSTTENATYHTDRQTLKQIHAHTLHARTHTHTHAHTHCTHACTHACTHTPYGTHAHTLWHAHTHRHSDSVTPVLWWHTHTHTGARTHAHTRALASAHTRPLSLTRARRPTHTHTMEWRQRAREIEQI